MIVDPSELRTQEVKNWKGLHLLHFSGSSCSQKVRILLREKGLTWQSHPIDLARSAHVTPWFLGINPRGVVPVLVHDSVVHVESNDILEYLDGLPSSAAPLMPQSSEEREAALRSLRQEDALHIDLRNLTMGFIFPRRLAQKSEETLERYAREGTDNPKRMLEVEWWRNFARQGVTEEAARKSAAAFHQVFAELDLQLQGQAWMSGGRMTVLDIAWFISAHRVRLAGYPLHAHARLFAWYQRLSARPSMTAEVKPPPAVKAITSVYRLWRGLNRTSLRHIMAKPA